MTTGVQIWHYDCMAKKTKKNPSDTNLLARSVVEAAIGEPLSSESIARKVRKGKRVTHKKGVRRHNKGS